jgi:predicted DCC family thiol-disulfide oxidoreductase YuxK
MGSTTPAASNQSDPSSVAAGPLLVYDGGCPFCRHFALLSELRGGIPGLRIRDGRAEPDLCRSLLDRGFSLADGAVLIDAGQVLHGAEAIQAICARMRPGGPLLASLSSLFADPGRSEAFYPLLLLTRRLALAWKGLPVDPVRSRQG